MLNKDDEKLYSENGVAKPTHIPHGGTLEEIAINQKIEVVHNWKQRGNELYCVCDMGHHGSFIPTTHIFTGTDDKGLPMLKKIEL
jgi:hypothetical protein